jgi:methyl-accepting chemotaxis protein
MDIDQCTKELEIAQEKAQQFDRLSTEQKKAVADILTVTEKAKRGDLSARIDLTNHTGDFRKMAEGINTLIDIFADKNTWYSSIIDAVPFPIHVTDMDMKWTLMNAAFEKTLVDQGTIKDRDSSIGMPCSTASATICNTDQCGIRQLHEGVGESYFEWGGANFKQTTSYLRDRNGTQIGYVEVVQDLTSMIAVRDFTRAEVDRTAKNLALLAEGNLTFDLTVRPANEFTRAEHDAFVKMNENLQKVQQAVSLLIEDGLFLTESILKGELSMRVAASRHNGDFGRIIQGFNQTLDSVIEPVNEAMRVANEFSQYNYQTRIDPNLRVAGDFIRFRDALNNIGVTISAAIGEVGIQVTDLAASAEEANASVEEVVSGAQQVAESAGKVSSNAEKGNQGLEQVLKAMEDLSAAVEEVTANAEGVAILANNANSLSKDGAELARKAEQGMVGITRSTTEVDRIIGEIKSEMQKIGKIVGLISDLANQTNLLALNAAIEAARAGEAGRGFAVVAAEVKSLAQESRTSAESIAEMIGGLQQKSEMAAKATASASKEVGDGSAVLGETLNVFNRIVGDIEKITRSVEEVAGASEEQAATVEEITASVHEVSTMVSETAGDAGDAAAASEESSAAIDEVGKIIENVNVIVEKVTSGISKFRV